METIKENRIFKRLYFKGKKQVGKYLVLYYMKNKADENYLGLTVSKKVGKAVKRNRVRRLVKEALRCFEKDLKTGYNIVIVARTSAPERTYLEIKESLEDILLKSGLLNEKNSNLSD